MPIGESRILGRRIHRNGLRSTRINLVGRTGRSACLDLEIGSHENRPRHTKRASCRSAYLGVEVGRADLLVRLLGPWKPRDSFGLAREKGGTAGPLCWRFSKPNGSLRMGVVEKRIGGSPRARRRRAISVEISPFNHYQLRRSEIASLKPMVSQ